MDGMAGWQDGRPRDTDGIGVAFTAYGLLCGVDSYEENGFFRLVSILSASLPLW